MTQSAPPADTSTYFLGHTAHERERLMMQSRFYRRETEQFLRDAGIREGMRVVDIGCGVGDVSFAVAGIVGPAGSVLGIDLASPSLEVAETRARELGLDQVAPYRRRRPDISSRQPWRRRRRAADRGLPAKPPAVMRHMRNWLHPGGFMAFLETDLPDRADAIPPIPLHGGAIALPSLTAAVAYQEN